MGGKGRDGRYPTQTWNSKTAYASNTVKGRSYVWQQGFNNEVL